MKVLEEAKKLGIQGVWLQPGTFDDAVLAYAMKEFKAAVGGDGGTSTILPGIAGALETWFQNQLKNLDPDTRLPSYTPRTYANSMNRSW